MSSGLILRWWLGAASSQLAAWLGLASGLGLGLANPNPNPNPNPNRNIALTLTLTLTWWLAAPISALGPRRRSTAIMTAVGCSAADSGHRSNSA